MFNFFRIKTEDVMNVFGRLVTKLEKIEKRNRDLSDKHFSIAHNAADEADRARRASNRVRNLFLSE